MNNISFFFIFRHKEVDSAVIFDETSHPQITKTVIYSPKSNRRPTLKRN